MRPSRFEWVANNRVTFTTNKFGTEVDEYYVDGVLAPMSGIGSLITFQGLTQGVLTTAARTIQSALDIEKAAAVASQTPMPSGYIKNTGADLPEQQVSGLLAQWKQSRQNRSTAYLTSTLSYETTGFSPKDMMYNDSIQFFCTQIARAMNVPAHMISADMGTGSNMTYQNLLESRKEFVSYSLQPFICSIEDRLSMDDITPRGHVVKFAIEESFLRTDTMKRLEAIEKMLNLGLIDVDDAKEMESLTPNGREEDNETYIQ
jgi:HK97 family phage portal protein